MRLFRTHRRLKAVVAFAGAFLLLAQSASAHHDMRYDVTHDSYVKSTHADISGYTYYGSNTPATSTLDLPSGYDVAQSTGTSPFSDNPSDEEQVGTGTATARWQPFCFSSNLSLTVTWETSIPSGAPSGTVGMVQVEGGGGLFVTDAFIVRQGTSDYKIETPTMPSTSVCDSTTTGATTLTIWGETADGSDMVRTPATADDYTFQTSYTDDASPAGSHSDSDTVTIIN